MKIVSDTTCDLPASLQQRYDIRAVPINIQFGAETYEEGTGIDRAGFYRKVEQLRLLPTTSQPSPGRFAQVYRQIAAEGVKTVLSVHVTAKLSGTCQSAELAKQMVAGEVEVHVFDSACGSAGLGFMALEGARLAEAGETARNILRRWEAIRPRMKVLFTMADLRYAQMSGRVGKLKGSLAALLNVKPIVSLEDGLIDVAGQVRSRKKAIERMLTMMKEAVGIREPVNLAVIHAEAPQEGQGLLDQALQMFNCQETFMVDLAASLAVHFGPGTLGLVAYRV